MFRPLFLPALPLDRGRIVMDRSRHRTPDQLHLHRGVIVGIDLDGLKPGLVPLASQVRWCHLVGLVAASSQSQHCLGQDPQILLSDAVTSQLVLGDVSVVTGGAAPDPTQPGGGRLSSFRPHHDARQTREGRAGVRGRATPRGSSVVPSGPPEA